MGGREFTFSVSMQLCIFSKGGKNHNFDFHTILGWFETNIYQSSVSFLSWKIGPRGQRFYRFLLVSFVNLVTEEDSTETTNCRQIETYLILLCFVSTLRTLHFLESLWLVAILGWEGILAPSSFFQQLLLTSCLFVTFWEFSQYFTLYYYIVMVIYDQWLGLAECSHDGFNIFLAAKYALNSSWNIVFLDGMLLPI